MVNPEWDAIKLGAKAALKARQAIREGDFAPFLPALTFALAKDGILDMVSAIPIAGLATEFIGLFITVFLFVFLFGKGTWKIRLLLFGLSCIDSVPVFSMLPLSTISVLYVWKKASERADQAKVELPKIYTNAQMIKEYQMARARLVAGEGEQRMAHNQGLAANDAQYTDNRVPRSANDDEYGKRMIHKVA